MPKKTPFKGVIENAYGKELTTPLKYSGYFVELIEGDEIPEKEKPDPEDLMKWVNNRRKASARQKSMQVALDAANIEKPTLDDPLEQFKGMVRILVKAGKDEDTARQMANANLGTTFDYTTKV